MGASILLYGLTTAVSGLANGVGLFAVLRFVTGFTGAGGLFMSGLLGHVRRRMLRVGLPAVLADLDERGRLRTGSTLRGKH